MIIQEDDLEFDEDMAIYRGEPFTGIVRDFYPDKSLKKDVHFVNGFEEGWCNEWYNNGLKKSEWFAMRGVIDGRGRKWHANGTLKSSGCYADGIELSYDEWDEKGVHIITRAIDKNSELYKFMLHQQTKGT